MHSIEDLNADILKITMTIQEEYPELYEYLGEITMTIPHIRNPIINSQNLTAYYETLTVMLSNYIYTHHRKSENEYQN